MNQYLLGGLEGSPDLAEAEILKLAADRMKRTGVSSKSLHFRLYKRSVDARKKKQIKLVYTVLVESEGSIPESVCRKNSLKKLEQVELNPCIGTEPLNAPPMIVGMGPAGLFCALILAQRGYAPILIDRGESVENRVRAVDLFRLQGILNPESNIQFGAGGAGTFSDGKLVTRIHDARCRYVLDTFHRFGAPDEIMTLAKPHIGTDVLRTVIDNMISEIQSLGGKVHYNCRMESCSEYPDGTLKVSTTQGDFVCGAMILAIGHSARDTYQMLIEQNFAIEAKPISVGFRAEHLQSDIDEALYGAFAGHPNLGHAEYALSDTKSTRGVYTFCMCPGGEVVAAASEEGGLAVNGMSNHARNGANANAAVLVSVNPGDFEPVNGNLPLGAIAFQRTVERAAFAAGGADYSAPFMTAGDFLNRKKGSCPRKVMPSYRNGCVRPSDFETVFPRFITDSLRYALTSFGRKIEGYDAPETALTAAETRTSSPIRILRLPDSLTAIGHDRIYPCGEGAGYAGGITSASVDGIRIAEAVSARFAPVLKDGGF